MAYNLYRTTIVIYSQFSQIIHPIINRSYEKYRPNNAGSQPGDQSVDRKFDFSYDRIIMSITVLNKCHLEKISY